MDDPLMKRAAGLGTFGSYSYVQLSEGTDNIALVSCESESIDVISKNTHRVRAIPLSHADTLKRDRSPTLSD